MLEPHARTAIARLVPSVASVKPLVEALGVPVRVVPVPGATAGPWSTEPQPTEPWSAEPWSTEPWSTELWSTELWGRLDRLLDRVARPVGVAGLTLSRDAALDDLRVFERVVSSQLALADLADPLTTMLDDRRDEVDQVIAQTVADSFDVLFGKETIASSDGVPLNVYHGGAGGEPVVLVPACGMPAALTESWMRFLARDRRVLAWESRGLFSAADYDGELPVDTAAQAADLFTLMDHYDVASAHVIGLCGGAVIGLAAAAGEPGRISSLSLWHGAYEFASGSPRTKFQNDLIELMAIASHSRGAARSVQSAFCQVALTSTPAEVAHHVLYPYANAELFYRYCRLNGALAITDVEQYLGRVRQPTLVVTSQDDETAHPQGSRQLADRLVNGHLRIEPHGDHASLFHADRALMQVAVDFIARQSPT